MERDQIVNVRARGECPSKLKNKLRRIGSPCRVGMVAPRSKHYPGEAAAQLVGIRYDENLSVKGRGWEALDGKGYRGWFPMSAIDVTDEDGVTLTVDPEVVEDIYTALDKEEAGDLKQAGQRIRALVDTAVGSIAEIGRELAEVKGRLDHGQFGAWCDQELGWGERTTRRYMQVARAFPQIGHADRFEAQALYMLSGGGVPQPARDYALEVASTGEAITKEKAADILSLYKVANTPDLNQPIKYAAKATTTVADRLRQWGAPDLAERAAELSKDIQARLTDGDEARAG